MDQAKHLIGPGVVLNMEKFNFWNLSARKQRFNIIF